MRRLLCQVCAGPADQNEQGVLWLLGDGEGDWPGWPEGMAASHPPVCLRCAAASTNLCPHLRRSHVAVRVREPEVSGVLGVVHRPGPRGPVRVTDDIVKYGDARISWVLASQQLMLLNGCSFIDLDAELSAAGLFPTGAAPASRA
jgi:hypothetical protein